MQLLAENTAHHDHPLSSFSWGNLKSLLGDSEDVTVEGESLWQDLRTFHKSNYCAERMTVVV